MPIIVDYQEITLLVQIFYIGYILFDAQSNYHKYILLFIISSLEMSSNMIKTPVFMKHIHNNMLDSEYQQ